jgi:mono/diheme cytochrome c family protein
MSMRRPSLSIIFLALASSFSVAQAQTSFSEPASAEEIALVNLSVDTDGQYLPDGSGTAVQGKPLYDTHCASCHGVDGEGTIANKLVGGHGTLGTDAPVKTVGSYWPYATTLFDYSRRTMPYTAPMSLSNDDYYAITAYILNMNDVVANDAVIDKSTLAEVVMPNRDGFLNSYPNMPEKYIIKN